ncbi:MAG TPA: circadian clock KaiB family protein [Syntrophorhabdaceae bacterium]|nr:circadian clock KaiB family protein [Syntrophorhabdaceae bacterium]
MDRKPRNSFKTFEKTVSESKDEKFVLRLYVAGATAKSNKAIMDIRKFCEENLKERCELEVIDIYQQPALAKGEQIIATPTLIKKLPAPLRRFIGDFSIIDKLLVGLDIKKSK